VDVHLVVGDVSPRDFKEAHVVRLGDPRASSSSNLAEQQLWLPKGVDEDDVDRRRDGVREQASATL
jgi:hypothetical protein